MNTRNSLRPVAFLLVLLAVTAWWHRSLFLPSAVHLPGSPAESTVAREVASPLDPLARSPVSDAEPVPPKTASFFPPKPEAKITEVPARLNFASAWRSEAQPEIAAFNAWAERWLAAAAAARPALLAEGVSLAEARRAAVARLIVQDPRQAIASAVPMRVRAQLPPEVLALLEERVSGTGDLALRGITPAPGRAVAEPYSRSASVEGKWYRAYTYGRRETQQTKIGTSILGVALDGAVAISESPLRVLEQGETPSKAVSAVCPISGKTTAVAVNTPLNSESATAVEAAGKVQVVCHVEHVEEYEAQLIAAEEAAGPYPVEWKLGNSGPGTSNITSRPPLSWSQGTKKILLIRVDFSDVTGTPAISGTGELITDAFAVDVFTRSGGVNDFYDQTSFHKTALSLASLVAGDSADVTPVYRLPKPASYYAPGDAYDSFDSEMHSAAETLATQNGYNLTGYDRIGVVFSDLGSIPNSKITYGGRAVVQGKNFWINGYFNFGTIIHELGHTYGLQHANLWQVADGNPVSPSGHSSEYDDPWDPMGFNEVTVANHFNHWEKSLLRWIPDADVTTVSTSGTYRVYRFDHASADLANRLALKIVRNGTQDFWIGYRRGLASAPLLGGASIVWGYNAVQQSDLLDFNTPGTDPSDAPLLIGQSFYDSASGVSITPLSRGGVAPNEYLDVQVNFGIPPGNVAPTVTLGGPATTSARQSCIFTAQAADADGDTLSYAWDFGEGATFDNNPSSIFAWKTGGTFVVKVTVSDQKGHSAQASKTVVVTDPLTMWSNRANSSVGDFNALIASPTKVIAVGEDFTNYEAPIAVSTDGGQTWVPTKLAYGEEAFGGTWDGSQFLVAGMAYDFTLGAYAGCVFTSPTADAGSWTRRIFTGPALRGVAFGSGVYVAVGEDGIIRRSTNATTWTAVPSGTTNRFESVAYGGGKFVAVGHVYDPATNRYSGNCTVLTSADGSAWINTSPGAGVASGADLRSIVWANDRFLASGWYSKLRYSLDLGATFLTSRTSVEETPALAFGNGLWFAAGEDRDHGDADIDLISTDGASWTALPTPALEERRAAIFFNNTFITAGANHSIRQSYPVAAAASGLYAWRESYFPDRGALSTYNADADRDGMSNFFEYAVSRSPLSASAADGASALPRSAIVTTSPLLADRIALQINLPEPAPADVKYIVEATSTLGGTYTPLATKVGAGAWTWNGGGTSRVVLGVASGGRLLVSVGDSQPFSTAGSKRFLRLQTSLVP